MSKYQRTKGRRGEQEITNVLKAHGLKARRMAMAETGGVYKGDVEVETPQGRTIKASVKIGAQCPLFNYKALANKENWLLSKRDREDWLITMRLKEFLEMLAEYAWVINT